MSGVIERVRQANPVPDESRPFPDPESFRSLVMVRSGLDMAELEPSRQPELARRGRLIAAIAFAAVVVLVGIGAVLVGTTDRSDPVPFAAQPTLSPSRAVERFFAAWNSGDYDAVLTFLASDFVGPGPLGAEASEFGPRFMAWLKPRGGEFVVSDCLEATEGAVQCHVAYQDPLHDALGLGGETITFTVREGLVERFGLPNYGSADIALRDFARTADPEGFETVCSEPGDGSVSLLPRSDLALTAECGQFLANHVTALIATIE